MVVAVAVVSQRVSCVKLRKAGVAMKTSTCTRTANTSAKLFNFEIIIIVAFRARLG